jgi:hypothetical protein
MQLTDLGYQAKQATGKVVASATERNVYGATAMKVQGQVSTDAALMEDSIIQGGEAATNEIQISLANAKYQRDSGVYQASMDRANMLNQRAGGSEIAAGMFSSAVKFGQAGYNLEQSMG